MNIKLLILKLTLLFHINSATLKGAMKDLKNKAMKLYKNKNANDKSWNFLGHDPSEYPGTIEKFLQVNKKKWDEYYECLSLHNNDLGSQLTVIPRAAVALLGSNMKFECKICISPDALRKTDSVVWTWASSIDKHLKPVQFTENIYESPEDKVLHIYNLQTENTGQYMCRLGESLTAPYFLTVVNLSDDNIIEVHPQEAPMGPYPKKGEVLQDSSLVLSTEWGQWSICNKCDKVGKRHKFGYCSIYLNKHYKENVININNASEFGTPVVEETDQHLFEIFPYGIPCKSHILSKLIKQHFQVKNRKNEIMTGYCKTKCPGNKEFIVQRKDGKILEEANNSAGTYSLLQSFPPVEPPIKRSLLYGVKGKTIVLTCPGNTNDAPLQWQVGNKNLLPEIIARASKGRIFISITDKIHIRNARISDSGIYSCWQQTKLAGTVRLVVEKKIELNFTNHVMLLGIVIVLSTFLYVFIKAFAGRKMAKN